MPGRIEVVCGCMYSGKTEELLRRMRRAVIAKQNVLLIKPSLDNRFSETEVVSHSDFRMPAINMHPDTDVIADLWEKHDRPQVVGVDEAQFLDLGHLDIEILADRGVRVIVAGLDMDYRGRPFLSPSLLAVAEEVKKLTAICHQCGAPTATRTQRLSDEEEVVVLGGAGKYEARCREHWTGEPMG